MQSIIDSKLLERLRVGPLAPYLDLYLRRIERYRPPRRWVSIATPSIPRAASATRPWRGLREPWRTPRRIAADGAGARSARWPGSPRAIPRLGCASASWGAFSVGRWGVFLSLPKIGRASCRQR